MKVLNRFALNDVVHEASWRREEWIIISEARFTGTSADGTIHFLYATRWIDPHPEKVGDTRAFPPPAPRIPPGPVRYDVHVSPRSSSERLPMNAWMSQKAHPDGLRQSEGQ